MDKLDNFYKTDFYRKYVNVDIEVNDLKHHVGRCKYLDRTSQDFIKLINKMDRMITDCHDLDAIFKKIIK